MCLDQLPLIDFLWEFICTLFLHFTAMHAIVISCISLYFILLPTTVPKTAHVISKSFSLSVLVISYVYFKFMAPDDQIRDKSTWILLYSENIVFFFKFETNFSHWHFLISSSCHSEYFEDDLL